MATTSASVIERALETLNDDTTTPVRWTKAKLLTWLNDGQRQIVKYKPDANVLTAAVQLAAGTKQALPAGGLQLVDITRNMGSDGSKPGRAIRKIGKAVLDSERPDWHSDAPKPVVQHYVFDIRNPKVFFVWPPQPVSNTHYIEEVYSATPPDATLGGNITIDDIYATDLYHYILHCAYSKDAEHAANAGLSDKYLTLFAQGIGKMDQAEANNQPQ